MEIIFHKIKGNCWVQFHGWSEVWVIYCFLSTTLETGQWITHRKIISVSITFHQKVDKMHNFIFRQQGLSAIIIWQSSSFWILQLKTQNNLSWNYIKSSLFAYISKCNKYKHVYTRCHFNSMVICIDTH